MFSDSKGDIFKIKAFVLDQPETLSFKWNDQFSYPEDVQAEREEADKADKSGTKKKKKLTYGLSWTTI